MRTQNGIRGRAAIVHGQAPDRLVVQPVHELIHSLVQRASEVRIRVAADERPDLHFTEQIVTAEQLVRAFPRQHHLSAPAAHQPRQHEHGECPGAHERRLRMTDRLPDDPGQIVHGITDFMMIRLKRIQHRPLISRFVEMTILEREGEGVGPAAQASRCDGENQARIEASA
ncbi:hypothetical protein D3C73_1198480 [compost metagenome]